MFTLDFLCKEVSLLEHEIRKKQWCAITCALCSKTVFLFVFVLKKEEKVTKQTEILDYYCCIRATLSEISFIFRLSCKFIRLYLFSPHAECVVGFGGRKISMKLKSSSRNCESEPTRESYLLHLDAL